MSNHSSHHRAKQKGAKVLGPNSDKQAALVSDQFSFEKRNRSTWVNRDNGHRRGHCRGHLVANQAWASRALTPRANLLMGSPEMQVALSKIRPHTSSNLAHQKKPAQLLVALELTIQSTPRISGISVDSPSSATPTAFTYFAALVTTLQGTLIRNETPLNDGDILPATFYLVAIVIPFVPPALLRSQSSTLLPILVPLLPHTYPHAPSLQSLVTIF